MRILLHDFGGYPFPAQLSRELVGRGREVTHSWCASLVDTAGPARDLAGGGEEVAGLELAPLELGEPLDKYRLLKRFRQERRYGRMAAELTESVGPELVVAANMPLDSLSILARACRRAGVPLVVWLQDLIGIGTYHLLGSRLPVAGRAIGRHYIRVERGIMRRADAIVAITEDFLGPLERWGIERERVSVIENWAPLEELPVRPKDNEWARELGLAERFAFVYTGAIGMKQDRELMLRLAERYRGRDDVRVVVVSGGPEANWLRAEAAERDLPGLVVRDFVPWPQVPDVMGAADVLVASIHEDAGAYSVPSKVLAYLCAGRAVLVSVPARNLAGRLVAREGAGVVASPGDYEGFFSAADRLLADGAERERMGAAARRYAEAAFAIGPIVDRFEGVLERARGAQAKGVGCR